MRNGSWSSAGLLSVANTGLRDSVANQLIVTPADVLRRYSQYNETSFTQFIKSDATRRGVPRALAPMDRKTLNLELLQGGEHDVAVDFNGQVLFNPTEGGMKGGAVVRGGAFSFEILGGGHTRTPGFSGVSLYADTLNNLGAGRLTIGARPTVDYASAGNIISFLGSTSDITLREGAVLSAPEVLLRTNTADGGITVKPAPGSTPLGAARCPYDSSTGYIYQTGAASLLLLSNG